jgi:hypothetical protein
MSEERNELNRVAGSGYLDGFPEPEVAYTRHNRSTGQIRRHDGISIQYNLTNK